MDGPDERIRFWKLSVTAMTLSWWRHTSRNSKRRPMPGELPISRSPQRKPNRKRNSDFHSTCLDMRTFILILGSVLALMHFALGDDPAKHLFILSGQSNMQGHRPEEAFTPTVEKLGDRGSDALEGNRSIGGGSNGRIRLGERPEQMGDLYDRLMNSETRSKARNWQRKFCLMQGSGARMVGKATKALGLHTQVAKGLPGMRRNEFRDRSAQRLIWGTGPIPHWTMVRKVQVRGRNQVTALSGGHR